MPPRAEGIVRALQEAGVQTVFGIPSVHNIALYEALRHTRAIRHIVCRHEAAATHMADGYARASGHVGIIISSTGPGAGLTLAALQEAWGSCSPVVMITTNIDAAKIGKGLGALHELEEQTALFRTVAKATVAVRDGDDCYHLTKNAIATALRGRPGPVYLEVPTDLLAADSLSHRPAVEERELPFPARHESPALPPRLGEAVALLRRARQPLIIAGTDAVRARLGPEITALAEALCAPVITSTPGKGIVAEDHPLAFGNAARRFVVKELVPGCDVALAIGTRLREVDAKRRGLMLPEQLIHVDWDERWVGKNFPTPLPLIGDLRLIAQELCRQLAGEPYTGPRQERVAAWRHQAEAEMRTLRQELVEIRYLEAIRQLLPRDSALVIDNTQLGYWAEYFYPSYQPHGLVAAKGSALLGFSFPGAIGVKLAWPEKAVVGLIGDGGFLYTAQELATCVRYGVGFPLIVVNDNAYGVIGYLQRTAYQAEYEARLTNPDFVAFAGSFGVAATRVRTPEELQQAVGHALQSGQMHLIELQVEIAAPPFGRY